ncbi:hypothetical protein FRC05_001183 [Tulasnella sp. 425]|nr:hypothetical protein FRC05_001183 [Tulasnella sp. 425]
MDDLAAAALMSLMSGDPPPAHPPAHPPAQSSKENQPPSLLGATALPVTTKKSSKASTIPAKRPLGETQIHSLQSEGNGDEAIEGPMRSSSHSVSVESIVFWTPNNDPKPDPKRAKNPSTSKRASERKGRMMELPEARDELVEQLMKLHALTGYTVTSEGPPFRVCTAKTDMRDESSGILVTDDDDWAFVFADIRKDRKPKVYFMLNLDEWVQMGFRAKKSVREQPDSGLEGGARDDGPSNTTVASDRPLSSKPTMASFPQSEQDQGPVAAQIMATNACIPCKGSCYVDKDGVHIPVTPVRLKIWTIAKMDGKASWTEPPNHEAFDSATIRGSGIGVKTTRTMKAQPNITVNMLLPPPPPQPQPENPTNYRNGALPESFMPMSQPRPEHYPPPPPSPPALRALPAQPPFEGLPPLDLRNGTTLPSFPEQWGACVDEFEEQLKKFGWSIKLQELQGLRDVGEEFNSLMDVILLDDKELMEVTGLDERDASNFRDLLQGHKWLAFQRKERFIMRENQVRMEEHVMAMEAWRLQKYK